MPNQTPRRGDPIIEIQTDQLGGKKLVASVQFQRFIESLGDTNVADTLSQVVYSLGAEIGKLFGMVSGLNKRVADVEQSASITDNTRGVLNTEIDSREDLEQFIHGN